MQRGPVTGFLSNGITNSVIGFFDEHNPGVFKFEQPITILTIHIYIEGPKGFEPDLYGSGPKLKHGLNLVVRGADGTLREDLFYGSTVRCNQDWFDICDNPDIRWFEFNCGREVLVCCRRFRPSPLELQPGDSLELVVRDNISRLGRHEFMIDGYYGQLTPKEFPKRCKPNRYLSN